MPKIVLTYFDFDGGRGEAARPIMHLGGIAFEDRRIPGKDWPALRDMMPFQAMPVLEVDGKVIAWSNTINRYLGKLAGLYPRDDRHAPPAAFGGTIRAGAPSILTGVHDMKPTRTVFAALALVIACQAWAGTPAVPTCNSGPQSGWKSTDALKLYLIKQTLVVKKVEIVGDCYAVYALNHLEKPANSYYHPVTLKRVGPIPN